MKATKRSKAIGKGFKHEIAEVDGLSLMFLFGVFKRMAYDNDLHRGDLEVLFCIHELSELNRKRLGFAQTAIPEVTLVSGKKERELLRIFRRLRERGHIIDNGRCAMWEWLPIGYSISRTGLAILAQYDDAVEAEQRRINSINKPQVKSK